MTLGPAQEGEHFVGGHVADADTRPAPTACGTWAGIYIGGGTMIVAPHTGTVV
ncbi:MAG: hypothetical protein ACRD0I_03425 [Acidimicrobiales bacterium]